MAKKILKRSLALGALMAFVITGSAMARNVDVDGRCDVGGNAYVYKNQHGEIPYQDLQNSSYKFELTKDKNNYAHAIGGNYFGVTPSGGEDSYKKDFSGKTTTFNFNTFETIVGEGVVVKDMLIAGNRLAIGGWDGGNIPEGTKVIFKNAKTNLTVNANSVIGASKRFVVAGDFVKDSAMASKSLVVVESNTDSASLTFNGGTINSTVVGGGYGEAWSGQNMDISTKVGTSTINITGGKFNEAILAGGAAVVSGNAIPAYEADLNQKIVNVVEKANVIITGGEFARDIYSGGFVGYKECTSDKKLQSIVNSAKVEISNVQINNFYAANAVADWENGQWKYHSIYKNEKVVNPVNTDLTLTNVTAGTIDVAQGSVTLSATENGTTKINTLKANEKVKVAMVADSATTDALKGDVEAFVEKITITNLEGIEYSAIEGKMNAGEVIGDVTFKVDVDEDGALVAGSVKEAVNPVNQSIGEAAVAFKAHYRAHMNDMNKRMGELRMANGETGVWTRMVRGENEFEGAKSQYNQYQLGYDEKLSVDKRWTVGAAVTFAEGSGNFAQGTNEDDSTAFAIYGSKLNNDGTFVDLIARYAHLESDLTIGGKEADYSTNGYSVSAEFGKRIQQGNGMWIEPQVELTYGSVDGAEFKVGNKAVQVGDMDSLIGRVGFRIGKDIEAGNVYARASYLYDFDGETENTFTASGLTRTIEEDLGGGWWEVGVGANINLSKATYIYADVEKTFGGEIDTNWQWNLGVRYSF